MGDDTITRPPTPTGADKAMSVALAVLAEFPGGTTVVGLLNEIFGVPYARRHEAWLRRMQEVLVELQNRDLDVANLGDRPEFVTAVHDATRIALGEHIEAKLDLLKAVLFNVAVRAPDTLGDLWAQRYLCWIDELEPMHIAILHFGVDPKKWLMEHQKASPEFMTGGRRHVFDLAEWPYPADVVDLVLEDLAALKLGSPGSGMVTGRAMYDPWITDRGQRFLDWLTIV